ncbi:MAG: tRNA (guanosine(46)-N7)-methyltransferase TrmB [Clostridia bacterium]|nr:tRNA (guanosine(46)-N7)-methyltransferase TrmB [Clostridia bacterium]
MRMRKKKHTDERLARCEAILVTQPETRPGTWRSLFEKEGFTPDPKAPLHLEIGCGKGAFILELAKRHPETLFVAVEFCREALLLAVEKVFTQALSNVLFLCADAAKLGEYFAPGEVDAIYLNFSDPWPKSRHAKRRLTAPSFLAVYRLILAEEGWIRQKTDNVLLFESSLESYAACGWRTEDICRDLHASPWAEDNILTEYEINFSGKGLKINAVTAYKE